MSWISRILCNFGLNLLVHQAQATGRTITHPKLPGYTIVISRQIVQMLLYIIYDKRTVWAITGPQRTGTYEKNPGYIEGTILDKWYGSAIVEATLRQRNHRHDST